MLKRPPPGRDATPAALCSRRGTAGEAPGEHPRVMMVVEAKVCARLVAAALVALGAACSQPLRRALDLVTRSRGRATFAPAR